MASRLSYFLTASTPDAPLLAAAAANKLDTPDGIRAEVTRLLGTEKGKRGLANFAREFFQLDAFAAKPMDDPRYTATLRKAMSDEVQYLYGGLVAAGVDALEIIDTNKAYVNDELARVDGITGITSKTNVPAVLPADIPRAGILGRGPFLAGTSADKGGATAPILRGLFIAQSLLCRDVPPPPPGVPPSPIPPPGSMPTAREQLERHRADPGCASCHALFDPMGLAFETFDPWAPTATRTRRQALRHRRRVGRRDLQGLARAGGDASQVARRRELASPRTCSAMPSDTSRPRRDGHRRRVAQAASHRRAAAVQSSIAPGDQRRLPLCLARPRAGRGTRRHPRRRNMAGRRRGGRRTGGTGRAVPGHSARQSSTSCARTTAAAWAGASAAASNPQNCLATCKQNGTKWAVACRVHWFIDACEGLPLDVLVFAPSAVPASPFESPRAPLSLHDIAGILARDRVIGLAEMMNYPAVIAGAPEELAKIALAAGKRIDGHAPGVVGAPLDAYLATGHRQR